jgi:hypothetical protein
LWCWQRSESWFGCQICVVLSESRVRCWIVLSAGNQVFGAELCTPHRIRCSLLNLCCP